MFKFQLKPYKGLNFDHKKIYKVLADFMPKVHSDLLQLIYATLFK